MPTEHIKTPAMETVTQLDQFETMTQIMPFGATSIACLTSKGRVLIPGKGFNEWLVVPTPLPYQEQFNAS